MSNNRNRGNGLERAYRRKLIDIGYEDVVTTRSESRNMDALGIDLMGASLPFYIQVKSSNNRAFNHHRWYNERLEKLPDDKPTIVFNRITKKSEAGRFMTDGEYVTLRMEDFLTMIEL